MKKFILVIAVLCLTFTLSAQKATVYLKNGSVLKGKIIEEAESKTKISLKDGSVFAYDLAEIDRIEIKETVFDFKTPAEKKWSVAPSAGYLYSSALWINREGSSKLTYVRPGGSHGFTAGAVGEYYFSRGFGVSAGLKFAMTGVEFIDSDNSSSAGNIKATGMDFTRYTVDIPLVANFYLGKRRMWYIQGGFNTSILVSGKAEVGGWWTTVAERTPGYILAPVNVQFILGAGYGPVSVQLYGGITSMWTSDFRSNINERLHNKTVSYSGPIGVSVSYTHKFKF